MKKKAFIIIIAVFAIACLFAVSASAKDYTVSNSEELSSAISQINTSAENSTITFAASFSTEEYMYFTSAVEVVIDMKGFTLTKLNNLNGTVGSGIYISNADATVTIKNGALIVNDVVFWPNNGLIIAENMSLTAQKEEAIWFATGDCGGVWLKNCTVSATSSKLIIDSGKTCDNENKNKGRYVRFDGCTLNGNVYIDCPSAGSYVKNCTITGAFEVDSWHKHDTIDDVFIIENVTAPSFASLSGAKYVTVKDSDISSYTVKSDGNGNARITVIVSPTCSVEGTQTVYLCGSETTVTSIDKIAHTKGTLIGFNYCNGFASVGNKLYACSECGATVEEEDTAEAILTALGYSTNGSDGISGGYLVNTKALKAYNELYPDSPVKLGIVIMNAKYQNGESFFTSGELTVKQGAMQVELKSSDYATFNFIIRGFSGDYAEMEMIIAAYAYTDKDKVELIQKQYTDKTNTVEKSSYEKSDGTAYSVTLAKVQAYEQQ